MYMYFCENEVQVIWGDPDEKVDWSGEITRIYDAKGSYIGTIWEDKWGEVSGVEIFGEHGWPVEGVQVLGNFLWEEQND